jgi:UDP:flavonoid glycosyltransferase YjiC (YdhE family)
VRYLFVTMDGGGNLYPELALATRLAGRGHDVRFLGNRSQRGVIGQAGFRFAPFVSAPDIDASNAGTVPVRDWEVGPETAFAAMCEHVWFGPAARIAADTTAEMGREPVDALAVDYFLYGALAAAEKAGRPTAALWHTTFGEFDVLNRGLPALNAARAGIGLPPLASVFEQFRRIDRVLVLTSASFDFAVTPLELPANARHVGPQLLGWDVASPAAARPAGGDRQPLVLVALSTTYQAQEGLLDRVAAALGTLDARGLVTTGPAVRPPADVPANVEVRAWIPHAEVLPRVSLVITHAGMGTVMAAMAYGVPMVCLPMGRDQDGNAARVERLGTGRVLPPSSSAAEIAADRAVAELEALTMPPTGTNVHGGVD